eukprot:tig00021589_g22726.t1
MQAAVCEALKKSELGSIDRAAKIDPRDVVWASDDLCFIGCGSQTNYPGIRYALGQDLFKSRRIAVVRDIFDRDPEHETLDRVLRLVTDDVTVVLAVAFEELTRRLVNEYITGEDGSYALHRHDINLVAFLHENGFRVVEAASVARLRSFHPSDVPVQQSTNHVIMVAPTAFEAAIERAKEQGILRAHPAYRGMTVPQIQSRVLQEFSNLVTLVRERAGVQVHLFSHERYHDTPDAVFPNNWFSTHTNLEVGECTLVIYPLSKPERRKERRPEFRNRLNGFRRYTHVLDLTGLEAEGLFLEGTGSLVLDRIHHVAYVALSERAQEKAARQWCDAMQYELVTMRAKNVHGEPVLHTDEMLTVGTSVAIVCAEAIEESAEREAVLARLVRTHDVVQITKEQMASFCGAAIELEDWRGRPALFLSSAAHAALTSEQREKLEQHATGGLLHTPLDTLEVIGGGSARALIAELF